MLHGDCATTFQAFYKTARSNPLFDDETQVLLHYAAAMSIGCSPCMQYYQKQADEAGICAEKIGAVQAIVMAVSAGRVQAQLQAAVGQTASDQGTGDEDCPCT